MYKIDAPISKFLNLKISSNLPEEVIKLAEEFKVFISQNKELIEKTLGELTPDRKKSLQTDLKIGKEKLKYLKGNESKSTSNEVIRKLKSIKSSIEKIITLPYVQEMERAIIYLTSKYEVTSWDKIEFDKKIEEIKKNGMNDLTFEYAYLKELYLSNDDKLTMDRTILKIRDKYKDFFENTPRKFKKFLENCSSQAGNDDLKELAKIKIMTMDTDDYLNYISNNASGYKKYKQLYDLFIRNTFEGKQTREDCIKLKESWDKDKEDE